MNTALWVAQIVLGVMFLMASMMKLVRTKAQLAPMMGWVEDYSVGAIRSIAILEMMAAIGLVLPSVTGIAPVLTPLAAVGLVVIMLGALRVHVLRSEAMMGAMNVMLAAIAAFVAWGRFGDWAL